MIKLLAETKGAFQLNDMAHHAGQRIRSHRPGVVENTHFIQDRIGRGQIHVIAELKDTATDADFVGYVKESEGDMQLAIDAFLAEFGTEVAEQPSGGKKKRAGKPKTEEIPSQDAE